MPNVSANDLKSGSYNSSNYSTSSPSTDTAGYMDDNKTSANIRSQALTKDSATDLNGSNFEALLHAHNLFNRSDIDIFNKTYRFGLFDPYGQVSSAREFLFFTKPDLNIYPRDYTTGQASTKMQSILQSLPYWVDLHESKSKIIKCLQYSLDKSGTPDPFNHLLQNRVKSNLSVPDLSSETIDTPTNMYGVGFSYRGSSEASDDGFEFSLEFNDSRWLETYYFFKTYEEYETLKHHGTIEPWRRYTEQKVIHDQFSIYKFVVDSDMETLIYWGKMYGVMPKSLPRDSFSNDNFDNGLSYSIDFKAAFYEELLPNIIADFNALSYDYYQSCKYQVDIYNTELGHTDGRPAKAAYIEKVPSSISPYGYVYKLKWRGDDTI
jgi:hypothetical protein